MNSSFGLFSIIAIASFTTCSLALQCYDGWGSTDGSEPYVEGRECLDPNVRYCYKQIVNTGIVYGCEGEGETNTCASQGKGCTGQIVANYSATICCCKSEMCNSATLSKQHTLIVIIAVLGTLILAL
uniref:Uncharacterized protein n=1 Tax=Plectus sambesii TaxID=2011161 RepID=A0A914VJ34_9BILA